MTIQTSPTTRDCRPCHEATHQYGTHTKPNQTGSFRQPAKDSHILPQIHRPSHPTSPQDLGSRSWPSNHRGSLVEKLRPDPQPERQTRAKIARRYHPKCPLKPLRCVLRVSRPSAGKNEISERCRVDRHPTRHRLCLMPVSRELSTLASVVILWVSRIWQFDMRRVRATILCLYSKRHRSSFNWRPSTWCAMTDNANTT
jgi:hypothetical protein